MNSMVNHQDTKTARIFLKDVIFKKFNKYNNFSKFLFDMSCSARNLGYLRRRPWCLGVLVVHKNDVEVRS